MLNTLVKSDIIEREPRNILVFHHSQGKLSKITLKLQPCMIICFFLTVVCPEDFSIPAKSSGNFKLEIQESILIKLLKPTLNKNISSVPLYLFWYDNGFCNYRVFVFPGPPWPPICIYRPWLQIFIYRSWSVWSLGFHVPTLSPQSVFTESGLRFLLPCSKFAFTFLSIVVVVAVVILAIVVIS